MVLSLGVSGNGALLQESRTGELQGISAVMLCRAALHRSWENPESTWVNVIWKVWLHHPWVHGLGTFSQLILVVTSE